MSRMTTRNGGVRNTDALTGNALDKPKEVSAVVDTAASSAVKRTSDLFTEADKDALQPGVSAQRVQDAERSLLGSAASGATSPPTDGVDKPEPADGAGGNNVSQEKRQATTAVLPTDDDEEDDGYLSDDPEERYDASAKREVVQRVRFAIVLLIPLVFKPEVTRVQTTLRALFALWKKELKFEIQGETKFKELSVVLLHARVRWGARQLRLLAVYFPAQAPPRGSFLGSEFSFFAADLPKGEQLVVAGDFNMIEDPVLDKSNLAHRRIPKGITDHKSGVCVRLVWRGAQEPGPGVWRFPARLAKRPGVKAAVAEVVQRHEAEGGADFDKLSRRLGARLRKYDKEERGRVKRTRQTLERQVSALQQKVMADPSDDELQAVLTSREAMLERYWDSRRDFPQTRTGLKVQLNGEAPTALLSAMVKSRKARTGIKELVRNGVSHTEAKEILAAATGHFAEAFGEQSGNDGAEPVLDWTLRRVLEEASAEAISRDWTEAEVKQATGELANGKSPGCDGIPKELFQHQWELLRKPVMSMVEEFVSSGKLPEVANEAVTIVLYKKGEETDVRNYRPITLLTSVYKILAKVVATRMKAVLDQVISKEQFGFLPGRRLTDVVSLVADLIETAKNEDSDWYLLLIDFEKAYDSVQRGFMLETIAKLGFPPRFVGWIETLHRDLHTRLCINGWTGEQIQMRKGVRQGCPLAPYLFLCAVEPLSRLVEKRELGLGEKGCERLAYVGYADDTTLLLEGEAQLAAAGPVLQGFAAVSGLKVNTGKSVVLPLGKNVGEPAPAGAGVSSG
ncbi:unnamed protein product [Closterium sp. NIES-65]|nr:unnamed protein product [Closterium sp. NIES-65]